MLSDLNLLIPEFRTKIQELITLCNTAGIEMRPVSIIRSPFEQAKLWRQSRTGEEIKLKIKYLEKSGAVFLAHCLESVGPQSGKHSTNALPGFSWHQWGEAIDCMWVIDGRSEWSLLKKVGGINGYRVYTDIAVNLGLIPGGLWKRIKDWPHVQFRCDASPGKVMSLLEIDAEMKSRFGGYKAAAISDFPINQAKTSELKTEKTE